MGGGSMMKAVAKVAGIGVVNSRLRGGVVPENPISAAALAGARPIGAIATKSSSDSVKASVAIEAPAVEKPTWGEIDNWEFAGAEEEILGARRDPLPRLVFGGAPTLEEAKEATTELKDALEVFVSSPRSSGCESLYGAGHSSGLSRHSNSEVLENKACLTSTYSTPNHAIQAFNFLDQSPEAQGVVASIASDPKVWTAVLQNPELQTYLQSHSKESDVLYQECPKSFEVFSESGKADGNILYQTSPKDFDESSEARKSDAGKSNSKNDFRDFWKNIKLTVVDMMSNLSDFFNSFFGVQGDNKGNAEPNPFPAAAEKVLGPSLMGVVVMVIVVLLLKRA